MKFTLVTNEFYEALEKVSKTILEKVSKTISDSKYDVIINNVKVEIKNNICKLTSTNLTETTITKIPIINSDGDCEFVLLDIKTLLKAMKFYNADYTDFIFEESKLSVKNGTKNTTQQVLNSTDFPAEPIFNSDEVSEYKYDIKNLSDRLSLVKYAVASINNTKPILAGVHFNSNEIVACDGFKLAINTDSDLTIENPFTIPYKSIKVITDILKDGKKNKDINIIVNHKLISFSDDNTTVICGLLAGDYIDYKRFIKKGDIELSVNVKDFSDNLKYLKTFITKNSNGKVAPIAWKENKLKVLNSKGMYETEIKLIGEFNNYIGFDCDYMLDLLSQFKDFNDIKVNFTNSVSPIILTSNNNTALLVPIRLEDINKYFKNSEVV